MSDVIRRDEERHPAPAAYARADLAPRDKADSPTGWKRFLANVLAKLGFKSLELVERASEAEVRKREVPSETQDVDNEAKLWKSKAEYDLIQSSIRQRDAETEAAAERAKLENDARRLANRKTATEVALAEAKAKEELDALTRKQQARLRRSAKQNLEEVADKIAWIRSLGGDVHIEARFPDGTLFQVPPKLTGPESSEEDE